MLTYEGELNTALSFMSHGGGRGRRDVDFYHQVRIEGIVMLYTYKHELRALPIVTYNNITM